MLTILRVLSMVLAALAIAPGAEADDWKRLGETDHMEVFAKTGGSDWCQEVPTFAFRFSRDVVVDGGFASQEASNVAKWARDNCEQAKWFKIRAQETRGNETLYLGELRKRGDWKLTLQPTWSAGTEQEYRRVAKLDNYGIVAHYGLNDEWCTQAPKVRVVPYDREWQDEKKLRQADDRIGKALANQCDTAGAFRVSVRESPEGAVLEEGRLTPDGDGAWKLDFISGSPTNAQAGDVGDIALQDFQQPSYYTLLKSYFAGNPDIRAGDAALRTFGQYQECPTFKENTQVSLGREEYLNNLNKRLKAFASDPPRKFYSEIPAEIGEYNKEREAFPLHFDEHTLTPLVWVSDRDDIHLCEDELKESLGPTVPHAFELDIGWIDRVNWVEVPRDEAEQMLQDRFSSGKVDRDIEVIMKYRVTEAASPTMMDPDDQETKAVIRTEPVLIAVAKTESYIEYGDGMNDPTPVLKTVTAEQLRK